MKLLQVRLKQAIAILIIFSIITTLVMVAIPPIASAEDFKQTTHFKTSFESEDTAVIEYLESG